MKSREAKEYPLRELYPEVRAHIEEAVRGASPLLRAQVRLYLTEHPLPAGVLLAPAACAAVGGDPRRALPVSAATGMLLLALRWFDDVQDRDRDGSLWQVVGDARAINLAAAALTNAWTILAEANVPRATLVAFGSATLTIAKGQELDLENEVASADELWVMMRTKTGAAYAFVAWAGATLGTRSRELTEAVRRFGERLGVTLQILDDMEAVFRPLGDGDLAQSKVRLALLYALSLDHPSARELSRIVEDGRLAEDEGRVRRILDSLDAGSFVAWAALQERTGALEELTQLGPPKSAMELEGRSFLRRLLDSAFDDLEKLTGQVACSLKDHPLVDSVAARMAEDLPFRKDRVSQ